MNLIRYFFAAGLIDHDRQNRDVANVLGSAGLTLSKIGMIPTVINEPAEIDCGFILTTRKAAFPYVTPKFFSRPVWPMEKHPDSNAGMLFAVEHVLFDDWRNALKARGLGGIAASYDATTDGVFVMQTNSPEHGEKAMVTNNVTLNFSNSSSFTGPLAVGQNIKQSYEAASAVTKDQLKDRLESAVKEVSKVIEGLDDEDEKNDVSTQLKALVDEASKDKPSKRMFDFSATGILDAAKKVGSTVSSVAAAISGVQELMNF